MLLGVLGFVKFQSKILCIDAASAPSPLAGHFPNRFVLHLVLDPCVANKLEVFILSCCIEMDSPGSFLKHGPEIAL